MHRHLVHQITWRDHEPGLRLTQILLPWPFPNHTVTDPPLIPSPTHQPSLIPPTASPHWPATNNPSSSSVVRPLCPQRPPTRLVLLTVQNQPWLPKSSRLPGQPAINHETVLVGVRPKSLRTYINHCPVATQRSHSPFTRRSTDPWQYAPLPHLPVDLSHKTPSLNRPLPTKPNPALDATAPRRRAPRTPMSSIG